MLYTVSKYLPCARASAWVMVIGMVNLQFQGQFVPISLRPIPGIVAAYVMATVCSSSS